LGRQKPCKNNQSYEREYSNYTGAA
jgi:hypothetical protein